MKLTKTFKAFFESEKAGGLLLLFVTIISLFLLIQAYKPITLLFGKPLWDIIRLQIGSMTA